jgi:uncharacterized membrane protein YdjX (TVP38/TMEM64 family)
MVVRFAILLALFVVALLLAVSTDVFDHLTPRAVHDWVRRTGVWAPAVYLAGFLLRPLTLVPLSLWLVAGGLAFGWGWAALYAVVGVNLGAAEVFLTARALGRDAVGRLLGRRRAAGEPRRPWSTRLVLSLQLFPFMPHDLLNAAAGCSTLSYWRFLAGSFLGTVPFVVLYTYAGSVLMAPGSASFYVAFAALAALSLAALVSARRLREPRSPGAEDEATRAEPGPEGEIGSPVSGRAR